MRTAGISLLAYDIAYFEESVRSYVDIVDEVVIGLDENRETWSGGTFELDSEITGKLLGVSDKVRIIQDQFYMPGLSPMENDTRERNFLSSHIEGADWLLSVDSDELLMNAQDLDEFLHAQKDKSSCVLGNWVSVYKELDDSYLVVGKDGEIFLHPTPIVTAVPEIFINARWTTQSNIMSPAILLHFTWARSEAELRRKLANWSHSSDFSIEHHFDLWVNADGNNYKTYKDFHPLTADAWPGLVKIAKDDLRTVSRKLARSA
ncbi:MAG: hypothetical protein AB7W16_10765 [Candidatus Obscuribacterales bacterium]